MSDTKEASKSPLSKIADDCDFLAAVIIVLLIVDIFPVAGGPQAFWYWITALACFAVSRVLSHLSPKEGGA